MHSLTYKSKHSDINAALSFQGGTPIARGDMRYMRFASPVFFRTCRLDAAEDKRRKLDETWAYIDTQVKLGYVSSFALWFPKSKALLASPGSFWQPLKPLPRDLSTIHIYRLNGIRFTPTSAQIDYVLIGHKAPVADTCLLDIPVEPEGQGQSQGQSQGKGPVPEGPEEGVSLY